MDSDSSQSIEVTIAAPGWHAVVTDPPSLCRRAALAALKEAFKPGNGATAEGRAAPPPPAPPAVVEMGVTLGDDALVHSLNRDHRGRDKPTNVLSFPQHADLAGLPATAGDDAPPLALGDVVLALETVVREAKAQGLPAAAHISHLVVHGTLHLLGHDHEGEAEALGMEALERRIVEGLGFADPYGSDAEGVDPGRAEVVR